MNSIFDSTPTSFLILADCTDSEYQAFVQRFQELEKANYKKERMPNKHCINNTWIIKPAAENQGRGIEVFNNDLLGITKFLAIKSPNTYWVIQKYIERPLLYKGRKFDIRMWAVMNWKGEFHYYKHGYIRTSSDTYSLNSKLSHVHLTNNCLQKHGDKYGIHEQGNTLDFSIVELFVKEKYESFSFEEHVIPRIKDLMIDTFLSVKNDLNPSKRPNCFELLGFDFMIDEDLRTWLIEVNTNPYLGVPNKFIEGLLPKMLNDLLKLNLDPYIESINTMPTEGKS